jgi:hypothetical protein
MYAMTKTIYRTRKGLRMKPNGPIALSKKINSEIVDVANKTKAFSISLAESTGPCIDI